LPNLAGPASVKTKGAVGTNAEDAVDLGPLEDSIGFLLRIAQMRVFEQFFVALGDLGLRPGEISVLLVIQRNPAIRQGLLAQHLMIKPAHMTKLIRTFEAQGLVARHIPDDNRRAVELSLTPAGKRFIKTKAPLFFSHERTRSDNLTAEERRQFQRLLRKFTGLPGKGDQ
jgi:DNA-binding MarR family transcriptional regulator